MQSNPGNLALLLQAEEVLKSHSHWVTSLAWHPSSPHQLVSTSYDRTVKQWDVRAAVPLHTLQAHSDKVVAATACCNCTKLWIAEVWHLVLAASWRS